MVERVILLFFASNLWSKFMIPPRDVPVERLVKNTREYIETHPDDPQGYYVMGRLYSIAFAYKESTLSVIYPSKNPEKELMHFLDEPWLYFLPPVVEKKFKKSEEYLLNAIKYYNMAIEKDSQNSISYLGLAWAYEQIGDTSTSLYCYRKAYSTALKKEIQKQEWEIYMGGWHGSVALEAGEKILQILDLIMEKEKSEKENLKKEYDEVSRNVKVLKERVSKGPRWITPLIIPLGGELTLNDLIDNTLSVEFDLDGDGLKEKWTWINKNAGFLVYDPENKANITSGRQLFGNFTWWIFWENGYEPLNILDDNQDGTLEGDELRGISIWQDKNSNGVSETEEVKPVQEWGVKKIFCKYQNLGNSIYASKGIEFKNGKILPTYDWKGKRIVNYPDGTVEKIMGEQNDIKRRFHKKGK